MGKRTEFNLRTVPMLFGVIDEKVTRGDLLDILKFEECQCHDGRLGDEAVLGFIISNKKLSLRRPVTTSGDSRVSVYLGVLVNYYAYTLIK